MALDYRVGSAEPNGLQTQSVKLVLREGLVVKRAEIVLPLNANLDAIPSEQIQAAWDRGAVDPLGLRVWAAVSQKGVNDLLDRVMFSQFMLLQTESSLAALLGTGLQVLGEDPVQLAYYTKLARYLAEADPTTRNQFIALALVVIIGKLGQ